MIEVTVERYYRRGERVGPVKYTDPNGSSAARTTLINIDVITSVVDHPDRTEIHTNEEGGRQYHVQEHFDDVLEMIINDLDKGPCSQPATCSNTCQDT